MVGRKKKVAAKTPEVSSATATTSIPTLSTEAELKEKVASAEAVAIVDKVKKKKKKRERAWNVGKLLLTVTVDGSDYCTALKLIRKRWVRPKSKKQLEKEEAKRLAKEKAEQEKVALASGVDLPTDAMEAENNGSPLEVQEAVRSLSVDGESEG